jgi:DNA helicase-2/ATP-dependent DNA helicase PcrA
LKKYLLHRESAGLKIDYRKDLNPEQYSVAVHRGGPMLVLAGAGSGKTRTVTYRVARLI